MPPPHRRRCARRMSCIWRSAPAFLPSLQGGFSAQRAKNAVGTLANPTNLPQQNPYYNLYTAQLSVSYLPDVFGGQRRALEAARAQAQASRFQLEATYLTLSSNVVVTAVQEASLRGQIDATERLLELQRELTHTVQGQQGLRGRQPARSARAAGGGSADRRHPAAAAKQLGQTRDALTALLGRLPAGAPAAQFRLEELTLASRSAGQPSLKARRAAARCAPGRSQPARGLRPGRRRARGHAAAVHHECRRPARARCRSASCSLPTPVSGARRLAHADAVRCRRAAAPQARRGCRARSGRRRSIAPR